MKFTNGSGQFCDYHALGSASMDLQCSESTFYPQCVKHLKLKAPYYYTQYTQMDLRWVHVKNNCDRSLWKFPGQKAVIWQYLTLRFPIAPKNIIGYSFHSFGIGYKVFNFLKKIMNNTFKYCGYVFTTFIVVLRKTSENYGAKCCKVPNAPLAIEM